MSTRATGTCAMALAGKNKVVVVAESSQVSRLGSMKNRFRKILYPVVMT
jgi:20S proteasome alpha/beta subunit